MLHSRCVIIIATHVTVEMLHYTHGGCCLPGTGSPWRTVHSPTAHVGLHRTSAGAQIGVVRNQYYLNIQEMFNVHYSDIFLNFKILKCKTLFPYKSPVVLDGTTNYIHRAEH